MHEPVKDSSNLFAMDQAAAVSVSKPPKPGARASMNADERDALEHRIRCQCGCTLDVYTCRTTDFSCQVSPAMHRDVMALVDGGYPAQEILDAFVGTYGERALMAPKREGFNMVGYLLPSLALAGGGTLLLFMIRRWGARAAMRPVPVAAATTNATNEEMQRLADAVRRDA
ncbi:MAG: cytochrome biosis protein [Gemmatimonadetes bacterium]|nr:cytochrome biosis protein [Gemmatimonadota bacterium]